jgi:hypothetical protein
MLGRHTEPRRVRLRARGPRMRVKAEAGDRFGLLSPLRPLWWPAGTQVEPPVIERKGWIVA